MIDLRFLAAIISDQEPGFLFQDRISEAIDQDAKAPFTFIREFYKRYNNLPTFDVVREETKTDLSPWSGDKTPAFFVDKIIDRYLRGAIGKASTEAIENLRADQTGKKVLEGIEEALHKARIIIPDGRDLVEITCEDEKQARLKAFLEREKRSDFVDGIHSPWRDLDEMSAGWHSADLISVIGTTSVGKTFFMMLLAIEASKQDKNVLFGSLEMADGPLSVRHDALRNRLPHRGVKRGDLNIYERQFYMDYLERKDNGGPITIANPNSMRTVAALEAAIEKTNPDILFVDSFYKMSVPNSPKAIWERVSRIVWELKMLAVRRDIPVIISGQFGRQVRGGPANNSRKQGEMQDVSFAYAIAQDSDVVISLNQDRRMSEEGIMLVRVLKMRNDEIGQIMVNWDLDTMNFGVVDPNILSDDEEEDGDA